jgi:hypothetical protein
MPLASFSDPPLTEAALLLAALFESSDTPNPPDFYGAFPL